MTFGVGARHALFGALLGLGLAGLFHSATKLLKMDQAWTWYVKAILLLLGVVLWLSFKILQERVMTKDYEKMVSDRNRRMH